MNRSLLPRLALAFVCLAGISACVVNLSFDMDQPDVALQSPVAGSASQSIQVDLARYKDVAEHKDNIRSLDLDYVDVTVTRVNVANRATVLNGTLALRRNAADPATSDVKVGDLVNLRVVAGSTVRIQGNPALDAFLLEQLHDSGAFLVVANGAV